MILNKSYNRETFLEFIQSFIPTFEKDVREVSLDKSEKLKEAFLLGSGEEIEGLKVFEFKFSGEGNKRISLTKGAFSVMKKHSTPNALAVFYSDECKEWRLSLLTSNYEIDNKGNVKVGFSNPKRFSFLLGPEAKVKTPYKFLIEQKQVKDFEDLKSRFSLEVVNKEFYSKIVDSFFDLVGGTIGEGKKKKVYNSLLKLPSVSKDSQELREFAVRLIGRIIFCWFLREKKSDNDVPLMPRELLSLYAVKNTKNYYHTILEPVFFEVLNREKESRIDEFRNEHYDLVPYLNGGLFTPQRGSDYYERTSKDLQSKFFHTLVIPDKWFEEFFTILEEYHFTIDENTSFDEDLSIDPEMLGRIFENLLAEINPETEKSARKETGSYYTPRTIVEYMIDESLYYYLENKTGIEEKKLRACISYDLGDDSGSPLADDEKEKIVNALETIKILDPACGSGAFPMGALQKLVFILSQVDPEGQLWFKRQIASVPPEIKRLIEKEFKEKNFDWLRKIGLIKNNIYGVDIQSIATEISRLRCFLTLVVDESVRDEENNRGVEPLPNLDFKFVTANSLIGLPKLEDKLTYDMPVIDDTSGIEELKEIRSQYFTSFGAERDQLKYAFAQKQKELTKDLIKTHGYSGVIKADLTNKITDWDPFSHSKTDWFDPEWMFGISEGFDVVIGNPPWGADLTKKDKDVLKNLYPEIDSSTPNSFSYFIGLGQKLTSSILCYVLPDSILIKDFRKTRMLLKPFIYEIAWYQNTGLPKKCKPFVYVEHDVCVMFSAKREVKTVNIRLNYFDANEGCLKESVTARDKNSIMLKQFDYVYNLLIKDKDIDILKKINTFPPLSKILQCHEGIHTGNVRNKLFLKKNLGNTCQPLFYGAGKGGDIIENYVSSRNGWFVDYRNELINKSKGEYASLRDERIFNNPKIYITRTGKPFKAFLDEDTYASNNFFSLQILEYQENSIENLKAYLPIILSKLTQYFIRKFAAPRLGETFVETKIIHLLRMTAPELSPSQKKDLGVLVDEIVELKIGGNEIKHKIDEMNRMVYELYGLTLEEIKVVEGSVG